MCFGYAWISLNTMHTNNIGPMLCIRPVVCIRNEILCIRPAVRMHIDTTMLCIRPLTLTLASLLYFLAVTLNRSFCFSTVPDVKLCKHFMDYDGLMDSKIFIMLYKALVCPHVEYADSIWSLYKKGDIEAIEKVQKRATKLVISLKKLPYKERLLQLNFILWNTDDYVETW